LTTLAIFVRFFVVLFAFWIAAIAAGAVLVLGASAPDLPQVDAWPVVGLLVLTTSAFVAALAFAPAAVFILLAEGFAWRSVVLYAVAGGMIGLFCGYTLGFVEYAPRFRIDAPFGTNFELMAAAGIAAGFVYWLIAGRTAGIWRPVSADRTGA
jgi:hypothetical protein